MVGVVTTLLKLITLYVLRDVFQIVTFVSLSVSYLVAVIIHFIANNYLTFKKNRKKLQE
ncbi:GtrA family protein [Candidatus Haliotispira prima]|uniref:GtrA family protein n=1 Tax=Candidatus Haliotispira prima TaxID=3034016 RepID=UPI0038995A0E